MPVISPALDIVRPAGKFVAVRVIGVVPVYVRSAEYSSPTIPVAKFLATDFITGLTPFIVSFNVFSALPASFSALNVISRSLHISVGVPEILPVSASIASPSGNSPSVIDHVAVLLFLSLIVQL